MRFAVGDFKVHSLPIGQSKAAAFDALVFDSTNETHVTFTDKLKCNASIEIIDLTTIEPRKMTVGDAFPKLMALILLSKTPLYSSDSRIRLLEKNDIIPLVHAKKLN